VARDDDTVGGEVETPVTLVIRRVADESTKSGAWGKFVRGGGCEIGVTGAPKSSEVMVRRWSAMKSEERGAHVQCLGRKTIDEVCGSG
jgi:hypothetical protein